jgi:hypothetical protein
MGLTFLERVQLKRAAEQVARPFRDIPGERPGNPNLLYRARKANPYARQLGLFTMPVDGTTDKDA